MRMVPDGLYYTENHEWAQVENGKARLGITNYAQEQLDDIVFVELPEVGDEVEQFNDCAVVESVKAVSDFYSPLSGEVVEINEAILDSPELCNEDPYGEGFFFVVQLSNADELNQLMDAAAYKKYLEEI